MTAVVSGTTGLISPSPQDRWRFCPLPEGVTLPNKPCELQPHLIQHLPPNNEVEDAVYAFMSYVGNMEAWMAIIEEHFWGWLRTRLSEIHRVDDDPEKTGELVNRYLKWAEDGMHELRKAKHVIFAEDGKSFWLSRDLVMALTVPGHIIKF